MWERKIKTDFDCEIRDVICHTYLIVNLIANAPFSFVWEIDQIAKHNDNLFELKI